MPKRILILVGIPNFDFNNQHSAVLSYLRQVEKAFISEGHEVVFDYRGERRDDKNTPSDTNNTNNNSVSFIKKVLKFWPWLYHTLVMRKYFKSQDLILKDLEALEPVDLIVEFHTVGSVIGAKLSKVWSVPLTVIFDSPVDQQFLEMHKTKTLFWNRISASEKISLEQATTVMCYSASCIAYIKSKYNLKAKVNNLPCVLTKKAVPKIEEAKIFNIGFIGSFLSWHRVEWLVAAFERFALEYPDAKLWLVGNGQEWLKIQKQVQESKVSSKVEMTGFVSEEELDTIKGKLDLGVMPGSNWYGSPLKLFEYAQSNIPFIAPTSKTVRDIFGDEKYCLYVDDKSPVESLYESLVKLYTNPELRNELGEKAHNFVNEEFGIDVYSKKLISNLS